MGLVENWKGDYERAAKLQTEALAIARERNLLVPLLFNFFLRGLTLTAKGKYDDAFLLFHEGLALSEQVGDYAETWLRVTMHATFSTRVRLETKSSSGDPQGRPRASQYVYANSAIALSSILSRVLGNRRQGR
jgi:tetratricopeptide (TPR) repeat protein